MQSTNPRQWTMEQAEQQRKAGYRTAEFLTAFFARATRLMQQRYGPTTEIHAMPWGGVNIVDADGQLGSGLTLRDAIAVADMKMRARRRPGCAECGCPLESHEAARTDEGKFTLCCDECCRMKLGLVG